jgi:hypothetical protein
MFGGGRATQKQAPRTERFQSSIFAPFRLARLRTTSLFGPRLKSEAAANGGLIFQRASSDRPKPCVAVVFVLGVLDQTLRRRFAPASKRSFPKRDQACRDFPSRTRIASSAERAWSWTTSGRTIPMISGRTGACVAAAFPIYSKSHSGRRNPSSSAQPPGFAACPGSALSRQPVWPD